MALCSSLLPRAVIVGVCRVSLRLPENHSLKGKRQMIKSLLARLHNKFNISAAEVDTHDSWQMVTLGVTCIANEERHAHEVLSSVISFIESERLDAELLDYETEVLNV